MKRLPALATLSLVATLALPALPSMAQSRSEKVDQIAAALAGGISDKSNSEQAVYTDARTGETIRATPVQLMRETMTSVDYDAVPGKLALEIWASQTQVPLVINWKSLEAQGVDPTTPITLDLGKVPAELVLKLIIQQLHPDPLENEELLLEVNQWYVRVMTKGDALKRSTTKLYFIGDLLMDIPNFDNAPGFNLNDALSNTSTGGSDRSGGRNGGDNGLFDTEEEVDEVRLTKEEKAERIADLIRNTIEPGIWRANGGEFASVRYHRGMLVVKAPDFVHEQIGGITGTSATKSKSTASKKKQSTTRSSDSGKTSSPTGKRSTPGNVAGVAR